MRLPGLVVLIVLALLVPSVSAGSEEDPEITDPRDQEWTPTDLLAAWFEVEEKGVRFSIKTMDGGMPAQFPDHTYWVTFKVDGQPVGATVGFGDDGKFRGHLGPLAGPAWNRGGFERVANNGVVDLVEKRGRPSVWSGVVPWGAVPGLEEDATLTDITAGTAFYDREANRWRGGLDVASARRNFVANSESDGFLPILVPAWVLPTIVIACVASGMGAGLAIARVKPKSKSVKVATPVPVRASPPPPGQRFQRAPPRP